MDSYLLAILDANEKALDKLKKSQETYSKYEEEYEATLLLIDEANTSAYKIKMQNLKDEYEVQFKELDNRIEDSLLAKKEALKQEFKTQTKEKMDSLFAEITNREY